MSFDRFEFTRSRLVRLIVIDRLLLLEISFVQVVPLNIANLAAVFHFSNLGLDVGPSLSTLRLAFDDLREAFGKFILWLLFILFLVAVFVIGLFCRLGPNGCVNFILR